MSIDIEQRVAQYVKLRDLIKVEDEAHKTKMKGHRDLLEQLNGVLLGHLNSINVENARTVAGTVYKTEKRTASVQDMDAFWTFAVSTGNFDLVDKRANVTACYDFVEQNKSPPPGVNLNSTYVVGVRRA